MRVIHAALLAWTGTLRTSACITLLAGNSVQLGAPAGRHGEPQGGQPALPGREPHRAYQHAPTSNRHVT